mgnify:CR=1 FL=1
MNVIECHLKVMLLEVIEYFLAENDELSWKMYQKMYDSTPKNNLDLQTPSMHQHYKKYLSHELMSLSKPLNFCLKQFLINQKLIEIF